MINGINFSNFKYLFRRIGEGVQPETLGLAALAIGVLGSAYYLKETFYPRATKVRFVSKPEVIESSPQDPVKNALDPIGAYWVDHPIKGLCIAILERKTPDSVEIRFQNRKEIARTDFLTIRLTEFLKWSPQRIW